MTLPVAYQLWLGELLRRLSHLASNPTFLVGCVVVFTGYALLRLWLADRAKRFDERMAGLRDRVVAATAQAETAETAGSLFRNMGQALAEMPVVGVDNARLTRLLEDAGFRGAGALATLLATKFVCTALMGVTAEFLLASTDLVPDDALIRLGVLIGALLCGWRGVEVVVAWFGRQRRMRLDNTLADGVDLMVISVEAGLSLEQTINFVAREAKHAFPEVGEEFEITAAELRVLGDRREALQNLARRINLPAARSLVGTLIQTMKYGTPLTDSLRILAAELRQARILRMEERAARLPVLMTLPLMAFILPCTFLVIGGPAGIQVMDSFYGAPSASPPADHAAPDKGVR